MTEVWSEKKCARLAKRIGSDAYGTKYHMYGFLPGLNYSTESPEVHEDYEIVYVPHWYYRIKRKDDTSDGWV